MYLVFVVFNDILFVLSQQNSVFNSLLTAVTRLGSEVPDAYSRIICIKRIALRISNEFGKFIIYVNQE